MFLIIFFRKVNHLVCGLKSCWRHSLRNQVWNWRVRVLKSKRALHGCKVNNEVRLSKIETSVGPYTLLETFHTSRSIQWIKLFLEEGLCNPADQSFLWVGLEIWYLEYPKSVGKTCAPTQLNSKTTTVSNPNLAWPQVTCFLLPHPMPGLTLDATALFPPANHVWYNFLATLLPVRR